MLFFFEREPPGASVDAFCQLDSISIPVIRPATVAELGDRIRSTRSAGQAIFPLGGRTLLDIGLPPDRPGVGVDLRSLDAVIDYPARDMTVTVGAGLMLAQLQALLATENQRLPVDVPRSAESTLGGALAVNMSGPRRYGAGTWRDYVIGITTVNDEGKETKAGGRVVKNVAGYDLCKLHTGALGTLGIISQVTLKVRPRPEAQALVTIDCTSAALPRLLDALHTSRTRPICLDLVNDRAARAVAGLPVAPWVILVGFEDSATSVDWQVKQLQDEIATLPSIAVAVFVGAHPLWSALVEFLTPAEATLSFKANLLPSGVAAFCLAADARPEGLLLHAHAGSGVVRGHLVGDLTGSAPVAMLKELTAQVGQTGNLTLPRCPTAWKQTLPVWGRPLGTTAAWLMRQVKNRMDPDRLFNPGRFLDGI
jgi:glycolate oxidase FAD binding subunit